MKCTATSKEEDINEEKVTAAEKVMTSMMEAFLQLPERIRRTFSYV